MASGPKKRNRSGYWSQRRRKASDFVVSLYQTVPEPNRKSGVIHARKQGGVGRMGKRHPAIGILRKMHGARGYKLIEPITGTVRSFRYVDDVVKHVQAKHVSFLAVRSDDNIPTQAISRVLERQLERTQYVEVGRFWPWRRKKTDEDEDQPDEDDDSDYPGPMIE